MLPVEPVLPALADALATRGAAVLVAPPGAGKTTRVPLALRDEPWLGSRKIVMLEPRRVAARAAARRMAASLGEQVGATIGFRVRADTRVGPATRVEVVTEGVLTRMLQEDPTLDEVGLLIFDEYHERSIHADLGLALALHARALVREDLRVLVMSATIDGAAVAALLGDAPVIASEGRAFPVETRWLGRPADGHVDAAVARAVRGALARDEGDVLAFLPGAGEIRRVATMLDDESLPANVDVVTLYGALSGPEQDRALDPAPRGRRKVVLATSIAETSLTIEGVRVVVDSGLSRAPRFDPGSGMTRLATTRVSRAAADQRRGRAGRTAPGVCYRLWDEHEHHGLLAQAPPEILAADLTALSLELAVAGITDASDLRWLTPPPAPALAGARELLRQLVALDASGRVTAHGRRMTRLPAHPRLAHMLLVAAQRGALDLAADVAALLLDRDVVRAERPGAEADLALRVELLRADRGFVATRALVVDHDAVRRAQADARHLRERAIALLRAEGRPPRHSDDSPSVGGLVALAYPERVARRRADSPERYVMRGGGGAALAGGQSLTGSDFIAIAQLDGQRGEARVWLAAALEERELRELFAADIVRESTTSFDEATGAVQARRVERLGAIVLADAAQREPDRDAVTAAFLAAVARRGVAALPWSDAARRLRERLAFVRTLEPEWPDVSDDALGLTIGDWLAPHLDGMRRLDDLRRLDLAAILLDHVGWQRRARLDALAPTHLEVPSGSRLPIDYADPAAPVLAVRLQEMFGLAETPRVGGGRVPLTLHLLSPAQRPVQVTRDLAGFWRTSYFDVRKDLRGRYPKHHWPENPLEAEPTRRAKRRGE